MDKTNAVQRLVEAARAHHATQPGTKSWADTGNAMLEALAAVEGRQWVEAAAVERLERALELACKFGGANQCAVTGCQVPAAYCYVHFDELRDGLCALRAPVSQPGAVPVDYVDVVFDGPPSHQSGRFVETESPENVGVGGFEWIDRGNGLWALRIPRFCAPSAQAGGEQDEPKRCGVCEGFSPPNDESCLRCDCGDWNERCDCVSIPQAGRLSSPNSGQDADAASVASRVAGRPACTHATGGEVDLIEQARLRARGLESMPNDIRAAGDKQIARLLYALARALADMRRERDGWEREAVALRGEVAKRRALGVDPWHWMGDGTDDLSSLTCPVLILPNDLRALAEAREDTARLDWLQQRGALHISGPRQSDSGVFIVYRGYDSFTDADLRAAIDAARAARQDSPDGG